MSARVALLLAAILAASCSRPGAAPAVPAVDRTVLPAAPAGLPASTPPAVVSQAVEAQPLPEAVEAASGIAAEPLLAAQAALAAELPVQPPPEPRDAACRRAAAALILRWEVTSPAYYRKRLERPVWPGGASGVTWGIGYDGGHQTRAVIADDWQEHEAVERLATTAGITGQEARAILGRYRDIPTGFEHASRVFEDRSLVEYERRTARAFRSGFDQLRPNACASLVSLVYNRGAAMAGDSRREMRNIRDDCIPRQDYGCIASEIRNMKRLWRGTVNERGLSARRESEALLAENP